MENNKGCSWQINWTFIAFKCLFLLILFSKVQHCFYIYIYIYIYIYGVLFGPVKPELGVIPSGQENYSKAEHLNFPGREINVNNITEQYLL